MVLFTDLFIFFTEGKKKVGSKRRMVYMEKWSMEKRASWWCEEN